MIFYGPQGKDALAPKVWRQIAGLWEKCKKGVKNGRRGLNFWMIIIHYMSLRKRETTASIWSPPFVDKFVNKSVLGTNHAQMTCLFIKLPTF